MTPLAAGLSAEDPVEVSGQPTCQQNEEWTDCGSSCGERYCCDSDDRGHCKNQSCPEMCEPRCECVKGFARDHVSGLCIPKEECLLPTVCGVNEELVCTTCSEPTCSQHDIMCWGTASSPNSVTDGCVDHEACYCIPGFKRQFFEGDPSFRGVCVPESDCPANECGPHEHFEDCTIPCWEEMCCPDGWMSDAAGNSCVVGGDCDDACHAMCVCDVGYIRDQQGNCVESCNGNPNDGQCPGLMFWNDCGNECNDSYCCPDGVTGCNAIPSTCTEACVPRCECPQGMVPTDSVDGCMPYDEACGIVTVPVECGENAFWNECGNSCHDHHCCEWDTECIDNLASIGCPAVCQARCECVDGYKLHEGKCTLIEEACTPQCTMENEVWNPCGSQCSERYCCDSDKGHCKNDMCTDVCEPRCECETGYARDHRTGHCVPKAECLSDPWCPENEHYNDHHNECDEGKCAYGWNWTCDVWKSGCLCNGGFERDLLPGGTGRCIPHHECNIQKCENNDPFSMYVENVCRSEVYCCQGDLCGFNRLSFVETTETTTTATTLTTAYPPAPGGGSGGNNGAGVCHLWSGCTCQPGYVWSMLKGHCILEEECFQEQSPTDSSQCPGSMYLNEHGNAGHDLYCCPDGTGNGGCDHHWVDGHVPRCECRHGMVPNAAGDDCILYEDACGLEIVPLECGENEYFNPCGQHCNDYNYCCDWWQHDCELRDCQDGCHPRCECIEGYERNHEFKCLPKEEACIPECGINEVWNFEGWPCKERFCCDWDPSGHCKNEDEHCPIEHHPLEPRCECAPGMARSHVTGFCIPKQDCLEGFTGDQDAMCPQENEQFTECVNHCDKRCHPGKISKFIDFFESLIPNQYFLL